MKIVIADDHTLFRGGLRLQLQELAQDLEIHEAGDFHKLFAVTQEQAPDMVIADLNMPGMPWRDAISRFRSVFPETRLVILSANSEDGNVREAIRLGANGFISKCDPPEVVIAGLKLVNCGGTCVPPNFIKPGYAANPPASATDSIVTHRQREVLQLIAEGLSNKQIAYRLQLTEGTVKLHVAAILKSLGANNRTQAVAAARESGLLEGASA